MARNILIFSDGTGQAGGQTPDQRLINVYKLYRATRIGPDNDIDPDRQVAFYDAGLGTDLDAASLKLRLRLSRWIKKFASSATGAGLGRNVVDCYEAILRYYEPGDRIYLFGFSRGAYTARCVGGVIGLCGIPTAMPGGGPIPKYGSALRAIASEAVYKVYQHGSGRRRQDFAPERKELARRFREKYSSGKAQANAVPYFIGVFDTVAALGTRGFRRLAMNLAMIVGAAALLGALSFAASWLFGWGFERTFYWSIGIAAIIGALMLIRARFKIIRDYPAKGRFRWHWSGWSFRFYDTYLNPRIAFARHALAIDETRKDFDRVPWGQKGQVQVRQPGQPEPFVQYWFAGNHSDVGGSYLEDESRLSDIALDWMIGEASALPHPILIDWSRLKLFPRANGMQHCEVESMLDRYPGWWPRPLRKGWGVKLREIVEGATLHPTVGERFKLPLVQQCSRLATYRPKALRNDSRFAHLYPDGAEQ